MEEARKWGTHWIMRKGFGGEEGVVFRETAVVKD